MSDLELNIKSHQHSKEMEINNTTALVYTRFRENPHSLEKVNDVKIMLELIECYHNIFKYMSNNMQNNAIVAKAAIKKNMYEIENVGEELRDNKKFILDIANDCPMAMRACSNRLREDKDLASIYLNVDDDLYRFLPSTLTGCRELAKITLKKNPYNYIYMNEEIKNEEDLLIETVSNQPKLLGFLEDVRENYDLVKKIMDRNPLALMYASENLHNNYNFLEIISNFYNSSLFNEWEELSPKVQEFIKERLDVWEMFQEEKKMKLTMAESTLTIKKIKKF
jgi:hypothetical protein